jgi:hypothetical protein
MMLCLGFAYDAVRLDAVSRVVEGCFRGQAAGCSEGPRVEIGGELDQASGAGDLRGDVDEVQDLGHI